MKIVNRKSCKVLAVVLCVLLTYPTFLFSAQALDTEKESPPVVVTSTLRSLMDTQAQDPIRVAIWLKDYDSPEALATESMPSYTSRLDAVLEAERTSDAPNDAMRFQSVKRAAFRLCYEPLTADFGAEHLTEDERIYCSTYLPIVIAELTPARIEEVANLSVVESIDYYCDDIAEEEVLSTAETDSARVINQPYTTEENLQYINGLNLRNAMTSNHYISVGILDVGMPDHTLEIFSDIYVEPHYYTTTYEQHSTEVLEVFSTVAPFAEFYCAAYTNTGTSFDSDYAFEMDWLIECGVSVINISLSLYREEELSSGQVVKVMDEPNTYEFFSQYLDKIVHIYDILIVKAAHNAGGDGIGSGGMAYNVLTVGNYNRTTSSIDSTSSYYNGSTLCNKPDISAPGFFEFLSNGSYGNATSYAAPLVAGVATLLIATNSALQEEPSTVKAILMNSTKATHRYTLEDVEYKYYGAGVIDAGNAHFTSTTGNYRYRYAAASEGSYIDYTVTAFAGTVLRITLVSQKVNTASINYSLDKLHLRLYNPSNQLVDSSSSQPNNAELIEYTVPSTGTYKIRIYTSVLPSNQAGTSKAYPCFSLAWSTGGN